MTTAGFRSLPLYILDPLCLLSYEQKLVIILVRQKQFGTYGLWHLQILLVHRN